MTGAPSRLAIVAPNWLGDAVMALPLVADLGRAWPATRLVVAARQSVAALFTMVEEVGEVITLHGGGGLSAVMATSANAQLLRAAAVEAVLLLPNSLASAWIAWRAGVGERWGFRTDGRGALLTRGFKRPANNLHQAEYYQALATALGVAPGPRVARVRPNDESRRRAVSLLETAGVAPGTPFVAMAPGAAYGKAKQWPPARFAELAGLLTAHRRWPSVLVGSHADRPACRQVARGAPGAIDLSGRTDLAMLAALLARATAVICNDSGAMHVAAAAGARVVAVFGPTNERETAPLGAGPDLPAATVIAASVWCRPCMLRECPIDHRCMTAIEATEVFHAAVMDPLLS